MDPVVILGSESVSVGPGQEQRLPVRIRNQGRRVESFRVDIVGAPEGFAEVVPPVVSVLPGREAEIDVIFRPPGGASTPTGTLPFAVRADIGGGRVLVSRRRRTTGARRRRRTPGVGTGDLPCGSLVGALSRRVRQPGQCGGPTGADGPRSGRRHEAAAVARRRRSSTGRTRHRRAQVPRRGNRSCGDRRPTATCRSPARRSRSGSSARRPALRLRRATRTTARSS